MNTILDKIPSKLLMIILALGVWTIAYQNSNFSEDRYVYITGGSVDVDNTVSVEGEVEVEGSVHVNNTVDINIKEINGHREVFYNNYRRDPNKYYRLPIVNE